MKLDLPGGEIAKDECPPDFSLFQPPDLFQCLSLSIPKWKSKQKCWGEAVRGGRPWGRKWIVWIWKQAENIQLSSGGPLEIFSAEWRVQLVFRNNFLAAVWRMDWRAWRQKDQLEGYYVSSRVAFSFLFLNIKLPGRNRFYIYNAGQITHTNTCIRVRISIWNPESTKHKALVQQCFTLLEAEYSDFVKKCWLHITIILSQCMKIKPSYCTPLTFM